MAYVPQYTITNDMLKLIVKVEVAREVILGAALVPYWERKFQNEALIKTVHHSTALEGNKLTIGETENVVKGETLPTGRMRDIREIINYRKAIGYLTGSSESTLTIGFITKIQSILGNEILPEKYLGKFRKRNAVIISSETADVVFDPPPPSDIEGEMNDLLDWINDNAGSIHPLIRAGILHYEIVRIHPFADLNGRTARLCATWSLYKDGYEINKYFSLEEYYDQNPVAYYTALDSANDGDMTEWLKYFVYGLSEELEIVKHKVVEISKDRRFKTKVGQIALNDRQLEIVSIIEENDEFTNSDFAKHFPKVSDDTILRDLNDLIGKKVIIKKGKTRGAKYVMA